MKREQIEKIGREQQRDIYVTVTPSGRERWTLDRARSGEKLKAIIKNKVQGPALLARHFKFSKVERPTNIDAERSTRDETAMREISSLPPRLPYS